MEGRVSTPNMNSQANDVRKLTRGEVDGEFVSEYNLGACCREFCSPRRRIVYHRAYNQSGQESRD